jgi:hypothetical protein
MSHRLGLNYQKTALTILCQSVTVCEHGYMYLNVFVCVCVHLQIHISDTG